jgi:hypothetical protein
MERQAAIRLLRALVAVGLRQRDSMANASIRSVAIQAGLDEFDAARRYATEQCWLVKEGRRFRQCSLPRAGGPPEGNRVCPLIPGATTRSFRSWHGLNTHWRPQRRWPRGGHSGWRLGAGAPPGMPRTVRTNQQERQAKQSVAPETLVQGRHQARGSYVANGDFGGTLDVSTFLSSFLAFFNAFFSFFACFRSPFVILDI